MDTVALYLLWQDLGDGLAWNPDTLTATFASRKSAVKFKAAAPCWFVRWDAQLTIV